MIGLIQKIDDLLNSKEKLQQDVEELIVRRNSQLIVKEHPPTSSPLPDKLKDIPIDEMKKCLNKALSIKEEVDYDLSSPKYDLYYNDIINRYCTVVM